MRRLAFLPPLVMLLAACPSDKKAARPPVVQDTTPMNLDSLQTAIPPAAPDTFTPPPKPARRAAPLPAAPAELVQVVEREQSVSRFCYQEFGQKRDPSLAGGVAMLVAVNEEGINEAKVQDDTWSSAAGKAVNACLNERAARAWKPAAGKIKPGRYIVQLTFRPS